jgi:plastocyanin
MRRGSALLRCVFRHSIFALLTSAVFAEAVVEGRVELPKSRHAPVMNKRYEIVARGGVLAPYPPFAVVSLEGDFSRPRTLPVQQMSQKDLAFVTPLLPVQVGTRVEFPNLDNTHHNIFSFSPTKRFDLGRYTALERPIPSQVFDKPGLVTLRCDIHEHMRGLVLVLDTPHFVKTDASGRFKLGGLPAGRYKLKAWLDSKTTLERPVDLPANGTVQVRFP